MNIFPLALPLSHYDIINIIFFISHFINVGFFLLLLNSGNTNCIIWLASVIFQTMFALFGMIPHI